MSQSLLLIFVVFFAIFTQSLTGFGSGLVSMTVLPDLLGMRTAVPLVALTTASLEVIMLIRYRTSFKIQTVWRMMVSSLIAIPFGVWALRNLNEQILLPILGGIMVSYSLYALLNFKLPRLENPAWAFVAGALAGLLSGAYSAGGPPAIIYGHCRGWKPDEFKSNLQGFFLFNDALALLTHAWVGNLTPLVWKSYLLILPAIAVGFLAGVSLDRFLNPERFRRLALGLLVIMGLRLILTAF